MTEITHILWTGGWDSTFRLLDLLSRSNRTITPHYILDPVRTGSGKELESMARIRENIASLNPGWEERISPVQITRIDDIPADSEIEEAMHSLRTTVYLGAQYAWLARYIKYSGVEKMDLCIESTDAAGNRIRHRAHRIPDSEPPNYEISLGSDAAYSLFKWFSFPLIHETKDGMERLAQQQGWWNVMRLTWFCHQPVSGKYTCGTCRPCVYVMKKRQFWRLDTMGRIRFYLIEKPRDVLPAGVKEFVRNRMGNRIRRFFRT